MLFLYLRVQHSGVDAGVAAVLHRLFEREVGVLCLAGALNGEFAYREHHAHGGAHNEYRGASFGDEGQGLARDRSQTHHDGHVNHGLGHYQSGAAGDEQCREGFGAFGGYHAGTGQQQQVKDEQTHASHEAGVFHHDGENIV